MEINEEIEITLTKAEISLLLDDIERMGEEKSLAKWVHIIINRINNEMEKMKNGLYRQIKNG